MKFNISANLRFLLLPLTLAITAAGAHAALCDTFGPSQGPRVSYQCADSRADTDGSIGSRTVIHPDQIGFGLAVAESLATSGGITAGFATAWASATPGVLRGLTFGEGLGPPIDGVFVSSGQGEANASFVEYGYLKGAPGVPVGTPVKVHMVFNIEGSFNNFNEAVARFYVLRNGPSLVVNSSMTAWAPRPNGERVFDLDMAVGDTLDILEHLRVFASGSYGHPGFANVSNTAHTYLDVTSGNATFVANSGFDYRRPVIAPAGLPEPSSLALCVLGVGCLLSAAKARGRNDQA